MTDKLTVIASEPLVYQRVSVEILLLGWSTKRYSLLAQGQSYPENIPNESGVYVLRIRYNDDQTISRIFEKSALASDTHLRIDVRSVNDTIEVITISNIPDLNYTALLKSREEDYDDLLRIYQKKLNNK